MRRIGGYLPEHTWATPDVSAWVTRRTPAGTPTRTGERPGMVSVPRLRPRREKQPPNAPEFPPGAFARALRTHTSVGGHVERGQPVPLTDANFTHVPEFFEVVWRPGPTR